MKSVISWAQNPITRLTAKRELLWSHNILHTNYIVITGRRHPHFDKGELTKEKQRKCIPKAEQERSLQWKFHRWQGDSVEKHGQGNHTAVSGDTISDGP